MSLWIYGVLDRGMAVPETATWIVLVAAQVAAGAVLGWWAALLPPALVLASVPAGYGAALDGEEFPIWFGVAALLIPALVLVVAGALGREVARRRSRT